MVNPEILGACLLAFFSGMLITAAFRFFLFLIHW